MNHPGQGSQHACAGRWLKHREHGTISLAVRAKCSNCGLLKRKCKHCNRDMTALVVDELLPLLLGTFGKSSLDWHLDLQGKAGNKHLLTTSQIIRLHDQGSGWLWLLVCPS